MKYEITTEQIRTAVEVALTLERGISEHVPDEMKKIFERAAAAVWNALGKPPSSPQESKRWKHGRAHGGTSTPKD
jgi:hypothetical protein